MQKIVKNTLLPCVPVGSYFEGECCQCMKDDK